MTKKNMFLLLFLFTSWLHVGQEGLFAESLFATYDKFLETSLEHRRIQHRDLQPLIKRLSEHPQFQVHKVGESIEGRELSLISIGTGETDVFLWSQMHGNEATATQAIFDLCNFLSSPDQIAEKEEILKKLRLHFLPMLNPDGAQDFQRRNALGIDINRDALMLQSPEGQSLKRVRDSLQADFGFNLHDQSPYYNAERTSKPATISYLAPAYNYEKDINAVRGNAMKVIVYMNRIIQAYAPGQVGRYNDAFEPRAFGDNIQKWGTSAILIESGGYGGDIEKQYIRKLNYVSILSAIYSLATGSFQEMPLSEYAQIPENDRKLFDLKIAGLTYPLLGKNYILDVGIQRTEVEGPEPGGFYYSANIVDQGDLSTFYGYETLQAQGYTYKPGKVYPKVLSDLDKLSTLPVLDLLRAGYTHVRVAQIAPHRPAIGLPINVIGSEQKPPGHKLYVGAHPNFLLEKDGKNEYAVINGFLIDLKSGQGNFKNALILK